MVCKACDKCLTPRNSYLDDLYELCNDCYAISLETARELRPVTQDDKNVPKK